MDNASSYEKIADNMPNPQNLPPPYSDAMQPPNQPTAPIAVQPPMPSHLYNATGVQDPKEEPILQPVQVTKAPDYLAYSIFTMLCCCLPLGVAALVSSILVSCVKGGRVQRVVGLEKGSCSVSIKTGAGKGSQDGKHTSSCLFF